MKKLLPAIAFLFVLASCKSSKDYLARRNEDKTLFDIVKQLNKHPEDEMATKALPEVHAQLKKTHLDKIATYRQSQDLKRWDKIVNEFYVLQGFYDAVVNSSAASKIIEPVNFQREIETTKVSAAEEYYESGVDYLSRGNWQDARKAYTAFKKTDYWINDYKGSEAKMDTAKQNSIVNVLINPVQDNSTYFNTGWSNNSFDFSNNNLPQNLVRDLGGKNAGRYPARFYTGWQAERDSVLPDWVVDLSLREVDIPRPTVYNYTRSVSKRVETGKDTSGNKTYTTVYATMYIQRQSFRSRASMDMNISEPVSRKGILFDSFSDTYNWQQEVASYSGDNRALDSNDWNMVNNRYNMPTKDDVLNELYRGIYPQVKNKISNAVDW
jgi:hypothetical protein